MIKLLIKFVVGILSIPLAFGVTKAFYNNLVLVNELANSLSFFLWGISSYVCLHLLFYKPTFLYVLGHESVHAGMAWIFGGKVKSFKVSKNGGAVATDKSNVLIELGPYFIPIYAIAITVVYFLLATSYNINSSVFVFLIGFALAFHIISTIEVMKIRQPDMMKSGYFFSIVMVYVLNVIVISVMFGLIFPSFSAKRFFIDFYGSSKDIYIGIVRQLFL